MSRRKKPKRPDREELRRLLFATISRITCELQWIDDQLATGGVLLPACPDDWREFRLQIDRAWHALNGGIHARRPPEFGN